MTEGRFSVRVNAHEGVVEIEGDDKDWIAAQLDKLAVVFAPPTGGQRRERPADGSAGPGTAGNDGTARGGAVNGSGGTATQRRVRRGGGGKGTRNADLEKVLTRDVRDGLAAFQKEREAHWSKAPNQLAIIATFLQDHAEWPRVDVNDIYTVYSVMGWPIPNIASAIGNARNREGFFGNEVDGKYELTHKGENFGRHDSKQPKSAKKK